MAYKLCSANSSITATFLFQVHFAMLQYPWIWEINFSRYHIHLHLCKICKLRLLCRGWTISYRCKKRFIYKLLWLKLPSSWTSRSSWTQKIFLNELLLYEPSIFFQYLFQNRLFPLKQHYFLDCSLQDQYQLLSLILRPEISFSVWTTWIACYGIVFFCLFNWKVFW